MYRFSALKGFRLLYIYIYIYTQVADSTKNKIIFYINCTKKQGGLYEKAKNRGNP